MSTFEFVTVLMSIIVGLGITRVLSGLSALIELRDSVTFDWLTLMWSLNIFSFHVIFWWVVVNNWRSLEEWTFLRFGPLVLYSVFLYFCAALVLPARPQKGLDLKTRFEAIRRPFFILLLLVLISELLDSGQKGMDYVFSELGLLYLVIIGGSLAFTVAAIWVSDRRFQALWAIVFFVTYWSWTLSQFRAI